MELSAVRENLPNVAAFTMLRIDTIVVVVVVVAVVVVELVVTLKTTTDYERV